MDIPNDKRFINIMGQRFGRLLVVSYVGNSKWSCLCDCGAEKAIRSGALRRGASRSCGCLQIEETITRSTTHGAASRESKSSEYWSWSAMKARCMNKKSRSYVGYGGRGISVCDRWGKSFADFLEDMGPKPTPLHTIERIDNDKGYEPGNCRWATRLEQNNNRRDSRLVAIGRDLKTVAGWARESGVPASAILKRLRRGWPPQKAAFYPLRRQ